MFGLNWENLNPEFRGTVTMLFGIVLLLHSLNILQEWLTSLLVFFSIAMIIYGFIEARLWQKISTLLEKKKSD